MREECRHFLQGNCRFGKNCRYLHIRRTALIDPPQWIHSCFPDVKTHEISPDEARLRFLESPSTFAKEWDDLFMHNYFALCEKLDSLLVDAKVASFTNRCVDIREPRNLSKIVAPFDHEGVTNAIDTRNKAKRKHKPPSHARDDRDHSGAADYRRDQHAYPPRRSDYGRDQGTRAHSDRPSYGRDTGGHYDPQPRGTHNRSNNNFLDTNARREPEYRDQRRGYVEKGYAKDERYGKGRAETGYPKDERHRTGRAETGYPKKHMDSREDTEVDLTRDDVEISEFLPNDDTEEFEF